jgi:hypothetical protein
MPYVSASGQYDINLLIPGCSNFQDCPLRTSVKVTVFPWRWAEPLGDDRLAAEYGRHYHVLIYSGSVVPSSPNFVTTVSMTLADHPAGNGQGGKYEMVADRVQWFLKSANVTGASGGNGTVGSQGALSGFWVFGVAVELQYDCRRYNHFA